MTDKAALLAKIKDRLPQLATQQCKKAPGHLAVFVKRADNQQPLSGVEVKAKGPSSADGVTDAEGWIIFTNRDPGGYRADVSLPEKLRTFRLPNATKNGTVPGCGTEIIEFDASPPKVGVALSFRAVLFKKDANPVPAAIKDFQVLADNEFPASNHLLADGESQGLIQIELMKLNDKGKSDPNIPLAGPSEHFDEGNLVLELSNADFGQLSYAGKSGTRISVPVKDIRDGKSALDKEKGVLFTTSRKIGEAKLTAKIENAKSYEYVADFKRLRGSKELTVGSRLVGLKTSGYDGRKVQWFLRNAGFLAYKKGGLVENDASREWKDINDIDVDGNFGERSKQCLRDFQRVARGSFRSQTVKQVTPTLTAAMSDHVTPEVISEFLEWRTKGYKVQPYNGYAHLKVTEGNVLDQEARIVYGALVERGGHDAKAEHEGDDAKGYVELKDPIGTTVCHWEGRDLVVADEIRSGIKLFDKEKLIFRLHDADPGFREHQSPVLDDEKMYAPFVARVKATIRTLRGQQEAAVTGMTARDVRLHWGFRTVQEQDDLYWKGRYRYKDKNGDFDYADKPPAGVTSEPKDGESCSHEAETIDVGKCKKHPHGESAQPCKHPAGSRAPGTCRVHPYVSEPCFHNEETFAVGQCPDHPHGEGAKPCHHPKETRPRGECYAHPLGGTVTGARGKSLSSFHQFGLAVDLVFNNANGGAMWDDPKNGDVKDWDNNGDVADKNGLFWGGKWQGKAHDPPHLQLFDADGPDETKHKKPYNDTNGEVLQKLQAVWKLLP